MGIFANRVKALRKENGWTQDDFARRVGVSRSCIGNWEQGLREPEYESLEKIADMFNVDIEYLNGKKPGSDLTVDERYIVEVMRTDKSINDRLLSYAKFLLSGGAS